MKLVIGCGNIYFTTASCFYWALLHQLIISRSALRKFCLANQNYISLLMWNSWHEGLWILDEGLYFERGSWNVRGLKATYIPEPSVVPATRKSKRDRSLGVLPWIPREEGPTDSTLTTTDFRAGRKDEHLRQAEDPLLLLDSSTPQSHATNNCNLKNNEYLKNLLGQYWNLDAEKCPKIHLPHLM